MVMHCKYACHIASTDKYYSMTIDHKKYLNTFKKPLYDSYIFQKFHLNVCSGLRKFESVFKENHSFKS